MADIGPANPNAPNSGFSDDDKVKDQLTYFFPKDDWKGEYGFDWFRLETCPDLEKLNDRGEKASKNFDNIGKYTFALLKRCEIEVSYDEKRPNGRVWKNIEPIVSDDERGLMADIKSDTTTQGYNDYQKLIDNDVDLAHAFSNERFAQMKLIDRGCEIPVVYSETSDRFMCFEYQPSYHIGAKSVKFEFRPHDYDASVFGEDEYVYYVYRIEYEKGKVKTLKIVRNHSYLEKTGEVNKDGEPKTKYVNKEEEREYGSSKGDVKRDIEKEKKDEQKRNKDKKKRGKKGAPEERQPYQKWDYDSNLIDKIYNNEWMTEYSLKADRRISEVIVETDLKELNVIFNDGIKVGYRYLSGELEELSIWTVDEDGFDDNCLFVGYGSAETVKKKLNNQKNLDPSIKKKVKDNLLNDVFVDYDDDSLKKDVKKVSVIMEPAYGAVMTLDVEKEEIPYTFQYGEKKPLAGLREEYKVKGLSGDMYRKNGRFGYTIEEKKVTFDEPIPLEHYWREYMDGRYWTVKIGDYNVFYPHPTLALVDYRWRDKKRGLENDVVELKVKTFGEFDKIKFESTDTRIFDTKVGSGSTTKAEDTIKLKAKHPTFLIEDQLMAYENEKNEVTGVMNVHVFEPIHLKICFIDVSFNVVTGDEIEWDDDSNVSMKNRKVVSASNANTGASKGWTPDDDEYLKILGQAGIIFDDIAHESMQVEEYYVVNSDKSSTSFRQSEVDMISGDEGPNYTDESVNIDNKGFMRLWDSIVEWDDTFGEFVVMSTEAWNQTVGGNYGNFFDPSQSFDRRFLKDNRQYSDYIRVYILDKYMINDADVEAKKKKDDKKPSRSMSLSRYQMSYALQYDLLYHCSFMMFKKSIEKTQAAKSNPLANALLRHLGLQNVFSSESRVPYAYKTTTNVMDYNDNRYSLNYYQWREIREGAEHALQVLAEEKKWWDSYVEPAPKPASQQTTENK